MTTPVSWYFIVSIKAMLCFASVARILRYAADFFLCVKKSNCPSHMNACGTLRRYFTKDELDRTASRFDHFSAAEEAALRREGATFINDVGIHMKLYAVRP